MDGIGRVRTFATDKQRAFRSLNGTLDGTGPHRFDTKTDANDTPVHSRDAACPRPPPLARVLRPLHAPCPITCFLPNHVRPVIQRAPCPITCVLPAYMRPA